MTYWHGGRLPHDGILTPQPSMRSGAPGDGWVYITTERDLAATYAATLPYSWVMEVEPIGEIEADPESILTTSFRCRQARVVAWYALTTRERKRRAAMVRRFEAAP